MRSFFVGTLVLLAIGFVDRTPARAISLSFGSAAQVVTVGEAVEAAVRISGLGNGMAPSLSAFDVEVNFDPAILVLSDISYGDLLLGDQLDLSGSGSIIATTFGFGFVGFSEISLDAPDILDTFQFDEFTLATATFIAVGNGTSLLSFTVNALGDANGDPLEAEANSGSVAVVPEPGTAFLVGVVLACFVIVRRKR